MSSAQSNNQNSATQSQNNSNDVYFQQLQQELNQLKKQRNIQEKNRLSSLKPTKNVEKKEKKKNVASEIEKVFDTFIKGAKSPKKNKESEPKNIDNATENVPIKEVSVEFEPSTPELSEFMKPVPDPKEFTLPKPIKDDFDEILLEATQIPKPKIILPLNDQQVEKALHHKIVDSIRWLREWTIRNILMYPKRVFFKNS